MIRKYLIIMGLMISFCICQENSSALVKAAQTQNNISNFEVETNQGKVSKYGYIKPAGQSYATNPKSKLKKAGQLPSKFGSTKKTVKNQNPWGTCWAFAGIGSFEYAVDQKDGRNEDYSEEHMIQRLSKNGDTGYQITSKNTGGNEYMYSGYFTSGMGPVADGLFPYNTKTSLLQLTSSILNQTGEYRATDIQFFKTTDDENGALSSDTANAIKQAVYENESVTSAITWDSGMIQDDNVSYYNSEDGARNEINHELLIIGWDDDYSADHFDGVKKNGAWLVRNSWGSNMGEDGYFWVSYQDKSLIPSCTIKNYETVGENDTIYNLDESGALYPQVTYSEYSKVGFINSFSLKKREKLKEVTFYESETGVGYQIFYVPVKEDGSLDMEKKQALTEKKTLSYPGYHTEKIMQDINVKKAAIMIMIDSNEEDAGFGAEGSISDGRKQLYVPTLEKGQSYIYVDNKAMDLYDMGGNFGNWSIKLVTEEAEPAFYSKKYYDQADLGNFSWTGRPIKPDIGEIYSGDDDKILKKDVDYKIEYSNNTDPGTATVKIVGIGDFKGCEMNFTYTIHKKIQPTTTETHPTTATKKKLSFVSGIKNVTYTGKTIKQKLQVQSGKNILKENRDYKVSYKNNKNCGIASVTITGIGNYQGVITKTFRIAPKKATIHSLKAAKKAATLMIRKNDGGVTGYEISYSYKKNFKGSKVKALKKFKYKTVKIKKKKYTVTSYNLKGLKSKKYVYFKVRSYKMSGKTKVSGSWSSVKKVKIK